MKQVLNYKNKELKPNRTSNNLTCYNITGCKYNVEKNLI